MRTVSIYCACAIAYIIREVETQTQTLASINLTLYKYHHRTDVAWRRLDNPFPPILTGILIKLSCLKMMGQKYSYGHEVEE